MKSKTTPTSIRIMSIILCMCMLLTTLTSCGFLTNIFPFPPQEGTGDGDTPGGDTPGGDTPGGDTPGGDTPGGDTETTYYKVSFAVAIEEYKNRVTLPKEKLYEAGTEIQYLPTPVVKDMLFMGWYYDATMTQPVALTDKVNSDLMLYAKVVDTSNDISVVEGVYYHTVYDAEVDYVFAVKADSAETLKINLSIVNVSSTGALLTPDEDYTFTDNGDGTYSVNVKYNAGKTYRATLTFGNGLCFVVDGNVLDEQVTTLNVLTAKTEVSNIALADGLYYIPKEDITFITETANGLVTVSNNGAVVNNGTGFFVYEDKTFRSGDRIAVYEGDIPSERDFTTNNGAVKYLTVTGVKGNNTYEFRISDSKEVLFIPDVIPLAGKVNSDLSIKVPSSYLDFSDDLFREVGLNEDTVVEKGDYIVFYDGPIAETTKVEYVLITSVYRDASYYYIDYTPVTYEEVMAAMDVFHTRTEVPEISDQEIERIKQQVYQDAIDSGFIEESADYLVNLYVSTNGLETMPNGTEIRYTPGRQMANARAGGVYYEVTKCEAKPDVKVGQGVLKHFEESDGIRVELILSFEVEFTIGENGKNKVVIAAEAVFEEEVLLSINVDGGAVWKKAWIFPYIADYEMNANIDIGTYTGVSAVAKVYTNNGEEKEEEEDDDSFFPDFDLDNLGAGDSYDEKAKSIGEELKKLFELNDNIKEEIEGEGEEDDTGNDITEKYAEMMKDANETWIEIVRVEIYKQSQNLDQYGILWFEIGIDFVVSAQLYIMAGIEVETGVAKRYNFSVALFSRNVKTDVIDLEKAHFSFKFYVMGTAGLKVGFEIELSLSLLSSDVASVGISAELGVQLGIWGYFYYSYEKEAGKPAETQKAGAMFFEIGIYLEVKFKAHLFNIDKLTYNPTLYENMWPIYSVGTQENVFEFEDAYTEKDLTFKMLGTNSITLPDYIFRMKYLDLKDGKYYSGISSSDETPSKSFDDATESRFIIEISDSRFKYDPATNTLSVVSTNVLDIESMNPRDKFSFTITLTYKHGALAFNQENITRDITIEVNNDANYKYLVVSVKKEYGKDLEGPASLSSFTVPCLIDKSVDAAQLIKDGSLPTYNEVIDGWRFTGWVWGENYVSQYEGHDWGSRFTGVKRMPGHKNISIFSTWVPVDFDFPVEYYIENLDGTYTYSHTKTFSNVDIFSTVSVTSGVPKGYEIEAGQSKVPVVYNGTHKVYCKRSVLDIIFGNVDGNNKDIVVSLKIGSPLSAPVVSRDGYVFLGWSKRSDYTYTIVDLPETVPNTEYLGYHANWAPRTDIEYTVKHYIHNADDSGSTLYSTEYFTGTFNEPVKYFNHALLELHRNGYPVSSYSEYSTVPELDGSTVIRIYYGRETFDIITTPGEGWGKYVRVDVPHGATVELDSLMEPTRPGYKCVGWDLDGDGVKDEGTFVMPMADVKVEALWEISDDIWYKIYHMIEAPYGGYYNVGETTIAYGTYLSTPTIESIYDEKFIIDGQFVANYEKAIVEQIELPSNFTHSEMYAYYDRVRYNINISAYDPVTEELVQTRSITVPYGKTISEKDLPYIRGFDVTGYAATGYSSLGYYEMPDHDIDITVKYTLTSSIPFTVVHHIQEANGEFSTESSTHYETIGYSIADNYKKYSRLNRYNDSGLNRGIYYNLDESKIEDAFVERDGSTVFHIYYNRATVNVVGYVNKLDMENNVIDRFQISEEYLIGSFVSPDYHPNYAFESAHNLTTGEKYRSSYNGYYVYCNNGNNFNGFTMEVEIVLKPTWGVPFTVNFWYENLEGTGYELGGTKSAHGYQSEIIPSDRFWEGHIGFTRETDKEESIALDSEKENVINIYHKRDTFTFVFEYEYEYNETIFAYNRTTHYVKYGAPMPTPPTEVNRPGYVVKDWGEYSKYEGQTAPARDITFNANFLPATDTPYKVNHYVQGLDGRYGEPIVEERTGVTGATVNASDCAWATHIGNGFSLREDYTMTISPDGSSQIDIYYVREKFTLSYHFFAGGSVLDKNSQLLSFGETIPDFAGEYLENNRIYEFVGYRILVDGEYVELDSVPATMVSEKLDIRVDLLAIGPDVTVIHKVMNVDGETYTEYTEQFKAVPFVELDLNNVILSSAKEGFNYRMPVNNDIPAADKTNIYEIYYERKTYTVTYYDDYSHQWINESYLFGQTLGEAPVFQKPGYTHIGWNGELPTTMPAGGFILSPVWEPLPSVDVTIIHMMAAVDGNGYVEKEREIVQHIPEIMIAGNRYAKTLVGGTFYKADKPIVENDGSTEVYIYYTRNEYTFRFVFGDVPGAGEDVVLKIPYEGKVTPPDFQVSGYEIVSWSPALPETMPAEDVTCIARWAAAGVNVTVNHYVESLDGTNQVITETETVSAETGTSLNGANYKKELLGFTYADADKNVIVMADGSTVINVYYTRNSYKVTYTYGDKLGESVELTVKYGAALPTAPTFTVLGYIFTGWDNELASTMPASNLTYAAQWTADTNVQFTVAHYYQNANDDGYTKVATETKYGTTGATVNGADYKKALAEAIFEKAESKTVNADGSTVIKVYYVRTSYTLTFTYGDKAGENAEYTLRYGQSVSYNPSFSVEGYVFAGWDNQIPATMPASDLTVNAIWVAGYVSYVVEHYVQNANDDHYTLSQTDNRTGVTGMLVNGADLATLVGNGIVLSQADSLEIAADGSTVIKIYYDRASYTVTYTYGDKIGEAVVATVRYGADLPAVPVFTVLGYTFAGWDNDLAATMPASNLTYEATWTANTDTAFIVEHYYQNVNDDGYTLVDCEIKYGTTDSTVNGASFKKDTLGFSFANADSNVVVAADGSAVVKVYYTRNSYKVTYTYGSQAGEAVEHTVKYGAALPAAPVFTVAGYVFAAWNSDMASTMPASNLTYVAQWVADDNTAFTVEHYYQNAGDDGYTLVESETKYGTTGATVNGADYKKALAEAIFERAESKSVNADGSTVIKVYYVRTTYTLTFTYGDKVGESVEYTLRYGQSVSYNPSFSVVGYVFAGWDAEIPATMPAENVTLGATWSAGNVQFTVLHYYQNANDDGYTKVESEVKYGTTGATANGADYKKALANAIFESAESKTVNADGSTVIKVYYVRTSYTLTFTCGNKVGESVAYTVRYGATLPEAPVFSVVGYTFAGWDSDMASTMPASNLTYNATWTANTNTAFTVEHYYQNAGDDGYTLVESETKYGTTNIAVNGADYKKALAEAIFERAESKTVNADGSTVIKVYYVRTSYTLNFTYGDKVGESIAHTVRYGATLPEAPVFSVVGYTFAGWDNDVASTMPASNLAYAATWAANSDTAFTVEHYYQNAGDDGYTKVDTETKYGTTGATVNGTDLQKALAEAIFERAESKSVSADGSTVIKVYYTRTTYTLTFTYGDKVGENATYALRYGQNISHNPSFTVVGYVFDGWDAEIPATMPAENITLHATWTAGDGVTYVVEHYVQNANNNEYTLDHTDNRTGVTGTVIDGTALATLIGNGIVLRDAESKAIAADGSTVIKIYYDRASYTVTYTYGDKTGEAVEHTVRYGATLPAAPVFTVVGYTFAGWDSELASTMPATNLTYDATWTANSDTAFTVEHYYQNANDNGYTKVESETKYGTTDATVSGADFVKTLAQAIFERAEAGIINADGSTVIKVYYTRTSYKVTYTYGDKNGNAVEQTVRYGATLPEAPVFSVLGYTFAGWDNELASAMPASNLTYAATWTANSDTAFTVEHYYQNAGDDGYALIETEVKYGTTDATVNGADHVKALAQTIFERAESKVVNADGSTVIKVYYVRTSYTVTYTYGAMLGESITYTVRYGAMLPNAPQFAVVGYTFEGWDSELAATMPAENLTYGAIWTANSNTAFTVEHYYQNANDNGYTKVDTETKYGTTGSTVSGADYSKALAQAIFESAESQVINADGSTVIKVYYVRTSYKVTYTYGDKNGNAVEQTVRYGATLPTAPAFSVVGYTFTGWDSELASAMPASNLTYHATWTANTDTAFTVEHYYQNANDDGYTLVDSETKYGTTDAAVNGADYAKALSEAIFERAESKTVNADSSTVIKVYYVRTSYTVTYTYGDKVGESIVHTVRYGATLPEAPVFNVLGYTFAGWDSELASAMPASNLTYAATWAANSDTAFTVEHYYQNANDDGYTLAESETKYGTTGATVNGADCAKALSEAIFERAESKSVNADGSTVIKVYYVRTTYTLTFTYGDKVGENATYTLRYGQSISYNPSFSVVGYVFAGWDAEIPVIMPAQNVTIDATWTASNVGYVVEHYVQNADNDDYTLDYSENRVGVTGTVIDGAAFATLVGNGIVLGSAETKEIAPDSSTVIKIYYNRASYTLTFTYGNKVGESVAYTVRYGATLPEAPVFNVLGYTFAGWDNELASAMPASNLTCNATWTANTDTEFTVEHYYQNAGDDGYTIVNSEVMQGTTASTVNGADYKKELDEAIYEKADVATIRADGSTVIKVYYKRTTYTLTFSYDYVSQDEEVYTLRYGATLPTAPVFSAPGYIFNGWYDEEGCYVDEFAATMPASNLIYKAIWMERDDTKFTVEHYMEQANGYGYDLIDTAYGEGRTDSMIDDYWQFVLYDDGVMYVFERFNSEELVINPDGSTVLKIYYQRVRYVVNFIVVDEVGNEVNGVDYITAEVKYGQTITPPEIKVLEGYEFVGFNSEHDVMPDYEIEYYIVWRCIHECNDGTHQCERCGEPLNCADHNDDGHCDYGREPMDPDDHRYVDEDEDHICDICFGSFFDLCFDNDRNAICDVCGQFTTCPVTGEDHVDADEMSDHRCDDCGVWMSYLCVLNDGKHECKVCYARFYDMCTDEDGDCWCDECIEPVPCTDEDDDGFCDVCENLIPCDKHVDEDQNALCDRCVENLHWCDEYDDMHRDDNMDHHCDHCGLWLSYNCSDWTDDGRCEDCYRPAYCMQELGKNHADGDGNHYCDECGCWMSYVCTDADSNWYCDECGNELQCFDHVDENQDGACDICTEETKCKANPYATYHEDSECDHVCDWCGVWVSLWCIDDDYDGYCDESGCGRKFVCNHVDEDEDNYCDRCYRIINCTHESVSMHICDTCNQKVTDCYSEDGDLFCDECWEEIECHHEGTMDAHVCTQCYAYLSNCEDEDGDGECDLSEYFPHSVQ